MVSRVFQRPASNHRKTLAWRPAKDAIDASVPDPEPLSHFLRAQTLDGLRNNYRIREIELVNGAMNWVDLDRCNDIETRLLEPEAQTPGTGK